MVLELREVFLFEFFKMIFKSFRKFKIIFLDVDHNRIYQCEKSKSKFVVFESQEKRQMCRSGRDEQCIFSKFENLSGLSFFP
jgi:hypothetical protein